ncbi:MAG TPA: hypothetical protein VGM94_12210 [Galbitalea sp.]
MPVPVILALVVCGILGLLALLQVALIAGAPLGQFAWGGRHRVLPAQQRFTAVVAILVYAVFALVVLNAVDVVSIFGTIAGRIAVYVLVAVFFGGFVMSAASGSTRERAAMTPTFIVLAALTLFVAVTGGAH